MRISSFFMALTTLAVATGLAIFCLGAGTVLGGERIQQNLDANWRFFLGDNGEAKAASFDDSKWRALDVPHDWSIEGEYSATNPTAAYCAHLPSGIGWYRRVLEMPDSWKGRSVTLEFEGVYMNSEVWLNGERVGGRPYGYSSFTCDLTAHLKPGRNVLAVRVDNSLEPSARWYHGCGIYGHVRLAATDPVHVPTGGVFVQTPTITPAAAVVRAAVEIRNDSAAAADVEVQLEVIAANGASVASATTKAGVAANTTGSVKQDLGVNQPALWSVQSPTLYTLKTRVLRAGKVVDDLTTPFGSSQPQVRCQYRLLPQWPKRQAQGRLRASRRQPGWGGDARGAAGAALAAAQGNGLQCDSRRAQPAVARLL